ncbi:OLC1v1000266C3 [Oldenlandia corymbosa var. corymbosa]|uniref:OLC1v1000266C3 n=1 Tax=Oldenlandia corymbosa var. corymbosa TaxID=529605 RepID=A0AAV1D5Z9_OLDCO|nr:OLC1v1000266C3 [Oldenlandia corymbosa var. corymbosa]
MHQKKSEVQIGKESSGISSDFNPTPVIVAPALHYKQHNSSQGYSSYSPNFGATLSSPAPPSSPSSTVSDHSNNKINSSSLHIIINENDPIASVASPTTKTTPHKRPHLGHSQFSTKSSNSLIKSPTLSNSLHKYPFSSTPIPKSQPLYRFLSNFHHRRLLRHVQLRRLRVHLRLVLLLSLPFFYFLVSHPSHSFILDFLSAFAFSAALLFSLNLALPRLPSIRLFLSRSLPIKLSLSKQASGTNRAPLPVFWSIGSRPKTEKKANSGCWVQAYSNGDVYEGEFHKGKCSGSGVYYYYMSGRYEGDWVDGKYDGYGVETWARGSRYRGQYRQGLRHGFGVYRFYTGDVYAGEWSNGQSHGCGVHTCDDGSRYVGEFKWGVKHGFGHYHFRNGDTYAGEYFADKMHGFGVYCFANGHRYEGAWHEGRRQGLGMYTFRNGETQSGHWQNGILNVPSTQNSSYPVSPVGVYHSKVLNAVQVNLYLILAIIFLKV